MRQPWGRGDEHPEATHFFRPCRTRAMWSASPSRVPGLIALARLDLELILLGTLLLGLIVGGSILVARARRWCTESDTLPRDQELQSYQDLVDRGELAPQEFERLKARLETPEPPDSNPNGPPK